MQSELSLQAHCFYVLLVYIDLLIIFSLQAETMRT